MTARTHLQPQAGEPRHREPHTEARGVTWVAIVLVKHGVRGHCKGREVVRLAHDAAKEDGAVAVQVKLQRCFRVVRLWYRMGVRPHEHASEGRTHE